MRRKVIAGVFALVVLAGGVPAQEQTTSPQQSQGQPATSQDSPTQGSGESGAPRSVRVGANVEQANLIHQVTPVYPEAAKSAHITGTVLLHATIGKDGTIQDLQYVSGPPQLMNSAMDAVRQWRYKPTLLNGSPVEVDTTISVVFTLGGSNRAEPGQDAPTQRPSDPNGAADYSQEPVVYEYIYQNLRYENDGSGRRETHGKIRVQTSAGLARAGQLVFEYNAANEEIEISSVRVEKPDGTIVKAGPENVQDLTAPVARQAPVYTDAREKHVTVPSLSVGDAVEYDVVISSTPVMAGQFWNTVYFSSYVVCLDEQVDLDVPGDRKIAYSNTPSTTEFSTRDTGDRRIYHWKAAATTIPKVKLPSNGAGFDLKKVLEGNRPPLPPHIFFSTFQSWSEVGKWYAGLVRDRRIPTPEIRARADEIVRGKTSELEKAEALYSWVAANIRYVSLSFGVGWYQPHSATEVLANRYGDCKDKSTLLDAFFAAEGLHAYPALIDSRADLDEGVPSPGQFDHAITYAQVEGKDIWLDSTLGVAPFGYLLPQLRGKRALVVTEDSVPELQKTVDILPTPSVYRIEVEGEVNKDAKLEAKVSFITRGDLEVLYRILYSGLSASQFNAIAAMPLANSLKATYASKLSDFVVQDVADTSKPLHMQFQFVGDLMYVDMKSTSREAFLAALIKALFQKDGLLALLPGAQSTMSDFAKMETAKLAGEKEYSLTITIKVPTVKTDGTENPQATHIAGGPSEYNASSHWDGQTLHANWELALRTSETSEARAKEYAEFCKGVIRSINDETSTETKSASGGKSDSPKVTTDAVNRGMRPHAEEVHKLYEQGLAESKRQNYANAVESFNSAVKLDPENPEAWRELGRAQMYLLNYGDADTDFRKYLALAPDDHLAYLNMAWVLYNEKKFSEDVELLEKRIAGSPNDGDANARLGAAYLALHQPEKALPVLKKAVAIFPKYEFSQFNLARAYLQLHQEDSAAVEFQRAIKLDDTSNTRNSAAYALAQANTHLETAVMWAEDAIGAVELELSQAKLPLQPTTMRRVSSLAAYWDTMGWIRFQQGKLDEAEKYIRAAAELADDSTILMHLGKIHEAQKRKDEAIEAYAEALASVPTTREADDDEKEARARLVELLGNESFVEDRVKQARPRLRERRSVSIPNPTSLEGIAQYILMVGPGSKVIDLQGMTPDDSLAGLKDALRGAAMPQSFPDDTTHKIPRVGTLSCPRAEQPCTFTFTPATAAARVVSAD